MAVTAKEDQQGELTRSRVAAILATHLAGRPKQPARVVDDLLPLVAEVGRVRVGLGADEHCLKFRFRGLDEFEVPVERAKAVLRNMCSDLAGRARSSDPAMVFGGVGYVPGPPELGAGFTMTMMNTMGEYWFDLAWQGKRA